MQTHPLTQDEPTTDDLIWKPAEPFPTTRRGSRTAGQRQPDGQLRPQLRPLMRKGRSLRGSALAFVLVSVAEDTRFELVRV